MLVFINSIIAVGCLSVFDHVLVSFLSGAILLSAICDSGIFRSYSLVLK